MVLASLARRRGLRSSFAFGVIPNAASAGQSYPGAGPVFVSSTAA
jgi:hypothetical protein